MYFPASLAIDKTCSIVKFALLMVLQEEASKLKYSDVKSFLRHVHKATHAKRPV